MRAFLDDLPYDLRSHIFAWYRMGIRKRMAQRRLQRTFKKSAQGELLCLFHFCNGDHEILLRLTRQFVSYAVVCELDIDGEMQM